MKLSTKTVATLLVVTAVAAAMPGLSQFSIPKKRRESQFDRLLARHDRKGELRADILGINSREFKSLCRTMTLEEVIQHCGLKGTRDFRVALFGRLRNELLLRGWSRARIDAYLIARAPRMVATL
jgi:hypothetical protein